MVGGAVAAAVDGGTVDGGAASVVADGGMAGTTAVVELGLAAAGSVDAVGGGGVTVPLVSGMRAGVTGASAVSVRAT